MSAYLHILIFGFCGSVATLLSGCAFLPPERFVDAAALPSHYVGREYRAFARGERLIIEVSQTPGLNVVAFDAFVQDDALYVEPRRISSGGPGIRQFEVDVSRYHLAADWPQHVFWVVESYVSPIFHPAFWSSEKRTPWVRRRMEVTRQ